MSQPAKQLSTALFLSERNGKTFLSFLILWDKVKVDRKKIKSLVLSFDYIRQFLFQ